VSPVESILIVKPSSLGDVVHTLPAVHLLKHAHPHARISWLINTEWAPLLKGNADVQNVIEFPRNQFRGPTGLLRLKHWLAQVDLPRPDLALDFQGLARSAFLGKFSGARRLHCLADAELSARLLADRIVPAQRNIEHSVLRYLRLISDLGIPVVRPLIFPLPQGEMPANFELAGPFLLIHPFSRGEGKSLSPENLSRLCKLLAPLRVVVVGRTEEAFDADCLNLCNQTSLSELIWLIRKAAFTVSVDSGPMHIAAAITERLLGIHTWSDPRLVGPCNPEASIWKNGAFVQVKDLPSTPMQGGRDILPEDLPEIAEFCRAGVLAQA
jgi:ADP-heptose:LPS heptosyltransferase